LELELGTCSSASNGGLEADKTSVVSCNALMRACPTSKMTPLGFVLFSNWCDTHVNGYLGKYTYKTPKDKCHSSHKLANEILDLGLKTATRFSLYITTDFSL
jgi:hypothetical protein